MRAPQEDTESASRGGAFPRSSYPIRSDHGDQFVELRRTITITDFCAVYAEAEYRAWLSRNPIWAAWLVNAGRDRERLQVGLARWIVAGMPAVTDAI